MSQQGGYVVLPASYKPNRQHAKVEQDALRFGKNNQVTGPLMQQNPLTCPGLGRSLSLWRFLYSKFTSWDPCGMWKGWISELSHPFVVLLISPEQQKLMSLWEKKNSLKLNSLYQGCQLYITVNRTVIVCEMWHD